MLPLLRAATSSPKRFTGRTVAPRISHCKRDSVIVATLLLFTVCSFFVLNISESLSSIKVTVLRDVVPMTATVTATPLPPTNRYIVVIDAGSSGSRAHVFQYDTSTGLVNPKHSIQKVKPGLSSYASSSDNDASSRSLKPLIEFARTHVPLLEIPNTKLLLKCTAGMRLLNDFQTESILENVRTYLATTGFMFSPENVEVIDGQEEGLLGWLAVNYLNQDAQGTWGVLEMGGASLQITLNIGDDDYKGKDVHVLTSSDKVPEENKRSYHNFLGQSGEVFVHSFLGLGLGSARQAINAALSKSAEHKDPCLQTGFVDTQLDSRRRSPLSGVTTATPAGDFEECSKLVTKTLYYNNNPPTAKMTNNTNCQRYSNGCLYNGIYAPIPKDMYSSYSSAAPLLKLWAFGVGIPDAVIVVDDIAKAANYNCAIGWDEVKPTKFKRNLCFRATHLHAFLIHGLGLSPQQQMTVDNHVGENSVNWALGAALQEVQGHTIGQHT